MKDSFYSSFENMHRGSRETIKERLRAYMPFVTPFKTIYPNDIIVDLGCGRGEWLELMRELGFDARGVDLDDGMLSYCHDLGLNVEKNDVISYLASIADDSVTVLSSFHLVEHIGFDSVKRLVEEAFRVLKPGGLLIMETPNPENIIVSTNNFYLDPTHVTPIPSLLLSFLTEHQGFYRSKVLKLQENKNIAVMENIQIIDVLGGVSPDYSVVAQKKAELPILNALDAPFSVNYGIGLPELSTKFHQHIDTLFHIRDEKISILDEKMDKLYMSQHESQLSRHESQILKITQLETEVQKASQQYLLSAEEGSTELKNKLTTLENKLNKLPTQYLSLVQKEIIELKRILSQLEGDFKKKPDEYFYFLEKNSAELKGRLLVLERQLEQTSGDFLLYINKENSELKEKILALEDKLAAEIISHIQNKNILSLVYSSTSWKLTAPLRAVSRLLRWFIKPWRIVAINNFLPRTKNFMKRKLISYAKLLITIINKKPILKSGLIKIINKIGCYDYVKRNYYRLNSQPILSHDQNDPAPAPAPAPASTPDLSSKAKEIYHLLNKSSSSNDVRDR